jgi:transcriptional regulator with XRE-family HTH domain
MAGPAAHTRTQHAMQTVTMLEHEMEKPAAIDPRPAAEEAQDVSFGARLRAERERRQISIASIADNTKILGALLEGLENNDVSRWPSGFYRRAFIRAYAAAIGLDPARVVREFVERFPEAEEQLPLPALVQEPPISSGGTPLLRLTLADEGPFFARGSIVQALLPRVRAVALDAFVLSVIAVGSFVVFGTFWAPLSVAIAAYYFGSILFLGNTPGVCLFAAKPRLGAKRVEERTEDRGKGKDE